MKSGRKIALVVLALAGFGALRMPLEARFTRELTAGRLLPDRLQLDTRERLGQTGAVVALGGLRTLIAALLNLRAFGYFEQLDWFRLEDTFDTIVTLAPGTRYYWDAGSAHLGYDASSDYLSRKNLPPLRRRQLWRETIDRAIAMLERGIRNNPDDWMLPSRLAKLLADPKKRTDHDRAIHWFEHALERGAPPYISRAKLYSLARSPGREAETLAYARDLHRKPANQVPSVNGILFAAESAANPEKSPESLIDEIFEDRQQAWNQLRLYRNSGFKGMPQQGVEQALRWLQDHIEVADDQRLPPASGK